MKLYAPVLSTLNGGSKFERLLTGLNFLNVLRRNVYHHSPAWDGPFYISDIIYSSFFQNRINAISDPTQRAVRGYYIRLEIYITLSYASELNFFVWNSNGNDFGGKKRSKLSDYVCHESISVPFSIIAKRSVRRQFQSSKAVRQFQFLFNDNNVVPRTTLKMLQNAIV